MEIYIYFSLSFSLCWKKKWPLCWHYARCSDYSIIPKIMPAYYVSNTRVNMSPISFQHNDFNSRLFACAISSRMQRWTSLVCYGLFVRPSIHTVAVPQGIPSTACLRMDMCFTDWYPTLPVHGFVGDSLDKNRFLGPITLKTALCITPTILLLLVNNARDSNENKETVSKLSFRMLTW